MLQEIQVQRSTRHGFGPATIDTRIDRARSRIVVPLTAELNSSHKRPANFRTLAASLSALIRSHTTFLLRLSLAMVFFWFGILKLANVSPVLSLLQASFPLIARSPYVEILGLGEIGIAIGLLLNRLSRHAILLMMLHLVCTLSIVVIAPHLLFAPAVPILTMEGEFVMKNVVLMAAGLAIAFERPCPSPKPQWRQLGALGQFRRKCPTNFSVCRTARQGNGTSD